MFQTLSNLVTALSRIVGKNLYIDGVGVRYHLIRDVGAYSAVKLFPKQYSTIYLNLMFNKTGHYLRIQL